MPKPIYLDYAAATPLDPVVLKAMQPYFSKIYANPSSIHDAGKKAKEAVDQARITIAKLIGLQPKEIIFTSGGTESVNLALQGIARQKGKGHIITSQIEHEAVLETCQYLEQHGFTVTYLPVDQEGIISVPALEKSIRKDTILISIIYANNEIGTIQPISAIRKIAQTSNIPFHTDACQAAGALDLNMQHLGVDLLSLNASKMYGPKGIGLLSVRSGIQLTPLIFGGGQEFNLRSGTENVPAIVGFAKALELAVKQQKKENERLISLQNYFIQEIQKRISNTTLNGHPTERLPNNVNILFKGVDNETLLHYLNQQEIYASSGSACTAQEMQPSHVLKAIGMSEKDALSSIRFTLGKYTTEKELQYVLQVLAEIVSSLRKL